MLRCDGVSKKCSNVTAWTFEDPLISLIKHFKHDLSDHSKRTDQRPLLSGDVVINATSHYGSRDSFVIMLEYLWGVHVRYKEWRYNTGIARVAGRMASAIA